MANNIRISLETDETRAVLHQMRQVLTSSEMNRAIAASLTRVGAMAKTKASREIRNKYKITKRELDKNFKQDRAAASKLSTTIYTWGRPIGLRDFKPKQMKKGVSVNITGTRKVVPHTFIAETMNGHIGVFGRGRYSEGGFKFRHQRQGKGLLNWGSGRWENDLEIWELKTVSQGVMFANDEVMSATIKTMQDALPGRLSHEMGRILARL